jgi:hypothetical protein
MRSLIFGVLAFVVTGCAPGSSLPGEPAPLLGVWSGRSVMLTLTRSAGSVEYDCAHGGLSSALEPDRTGAFNVTGVHVREHGGPIREGEVPDSVPARYEGVVRGEQMTLRVFAGQDTLGPFTLRRNGAPQLVKCL